MQACCTIVWRYGPAPHVQSGFGSPIQVADSVDFPEEAVASLVGQCGNTERR
jgi:hypothetical protein